MKPRTPEEYQEGLERCEADCRRMEEIVFEMLTLARVDGGERRAAIVAATNVSGCIRQVADQFSSMATLKRVSIVVSAPEPMFAMLGMQDCSLLLSNLVLNAIQHSYADSLVKVSAVRESDEV